MRVIRSRFAERVIQDLLLSHSDGVVVVSLDGKAALYSPYGSETDPKSVPWYRITKTRDAFTAEVVGRRGTACR